jgi:predicted lipoprotein with Yx(FWY)xxD motif
MRHLEAPCEGNAQIRHDRRGAAVRIAVGTSLAALILAAFPALSSAFMAAPIVEANPAVQVAGGFDLRGTIYPYELDTHYHFEYGTTTAYGTSVPVPEGDAGSTNGPVQVSQTVTGLTANTTYHFRLLASNADGSATPSNDQSFTTPADPSAPPPAPTPEPGQNQSPSAHPGKKVKVKEARYKGRTILTTATGHTLYSLSVEKNGKFICTKSSGCLALWHPLMIASGAKPVGPVMLGTIKRPEGGTQVTFHGRPLYSFAPDKKPGQAKGEGIKDVGTWHAATVGKQGH